MIMMTYRYTFTIPCYRVRKMKERYAVSQMRKQANRMTFGEVQIKQLSLVATVDIRGEETVSYRIARNYWR